MITKILNDFKNFRDLIIVIIFIIVIGLEKYGFVEQSNINNFAIYATIFLIYLLSSVLIKNIKSRTIVNVDSFINELKKHLSHTQVPFFVRVLNVSSDQQAKSISQKIIASSYWDWTFICPNSKGCEHICSNLSNEIHSQYFHGEAIKSSTLAFLKSPIDGEKNYIFFGNLKCPPGLSTVEKFPALPFDLDIEQNYSIYFDKLLIFDSYYNNKRKRCFITNTHIVSDINEIKKTWNSVKKELEATSDLVCTWKDKILNSEVLSQIKNKLEEFGINKPCSNYIGLNFEENAASYSKKVKDLIGNGFIYTLFYIGLILSPLTLWNDAFVNIPLSSIMAALLYNYLQPHPNLTVLVSISYLFTNLIGILFIFIAGRKLKLIWQKPPLKVYCTFISYLIAANLIVYIISNQNFAGIIAYFM